MQLHKYRFMPGYDVLVVGAGLSGLFAGALAARRGARVAVVARGQGGLGLSGGSVGVLGYDSSGQPLEVWDKAWAKIRRGKHPYAWVTREELDQALGEFLNLTMEGGYPMLYRSGTNFLLPTAAGATRACALVPESMASGDLRGPGEFVLAEFPGLRDFYPAFAVENLTRSPGIAARTIPLALPDAPSRRDAYNTDLAGLFDDPAYRAKASKLWQTELNSARRLGLPAVLGLRHAAAAWRDLSDHLGVDVFEIPLPPPSVPGLRLFNLLVEALRKRRGELVLGPRASGRVEKRYGVRRVVGVSLETAGGRRDLNADAVILASGGFLNGGLELRQDGTVTESVFSLPIPLPSRKSNRSNDFSRYYDESYLSAHPYSRLGLSVDERLQPLEATGVPAYENLYAVGGILAGADRITEGSREGIDLATSRKAVSLLAGEHEALSVRIRAQNR